MAMAMGRLSVAKAAVSSATRWRLATHPGVTKLKEAGAGSRRRQGLIRHNKNCTPIRRRVIEIA